MMRLITSVPEAWEKLVVVISRGFDDERASVAWSIAYGWICAIHMLAGYGSVLARVHMQIDYLILKKI